MGLSTQPIRPCLYPVRPPHRRNGAEPPDGIRAGDGGVQAGRCGSTSVVAIPAKRKASTSGSKHMHSGICYFGFVPPDKSNLDWGE